MIELTEDDIVVSLRYPESYSDEGYQVQIEIGNCGYDETNKLKQQILNNQEDSKKYKKWVIDNWNEKTWQSISQNQKLRELTEKRIEELKNKTVGFRSNEEDYELEDLENLLRNSENGP